jgi:hypothetical protein
MGCTRDEFLAWLPGAVRGARYEAAEAKTPMAASFNATAME